MNLEEKFIALESQMTTQQTEVINALNAILEALGAPPPAPTITLANISTQLTAINNNLIGMAIANGSFHTDLLYVIGQINVNTDTLITNNSLNAQRIIAALYATFCDCATDAPLLAPPIDVTPTSLVDEDKCRRIQFYLDLFGQWLNAIANYGNAGAAITGGTLATLLAGVVQAAGVVATGVEAGALGGPPGMIIAGAVALITVAVYTIGGSFLVDFAAQFNAPTLRDNMVQAMYAASNAEEGYIAFKTTLLAGMDAIPAEVIYTLWWSAWSNDVYSGSPVVDDSAFDGTICAPEPEGCTTLISALYYGENQVFINQTFTGYDYYHVLATNATGNFNLGVWINSVEQVGVYGNYEGYFSTNLDFTFQCSSFTPGGADVLVEGCMGIPPV